MIGIKVEKAHGEYDFPNSKILTETRFRTKRASFIFFSPETEKIIRRMSGIARKNPKR